MKTDKTDDYQEKREEKETIYKILDRFTRLCHERIDKAELGQKTVREEICRIQNINFFSKYPVTIIRARARGKYRPSFVHTSPIVINVTRVTPLFPSTILTNVTPVYRSKIDNNVTYPNVPPTHTSKCNTVVIFPLYTLVYSTLPRVPNMESILGLLSVLFSMHKERSLTSLEMSFPVSICIGGD